ncbi:23S rRNA (cytidine(2498)-2'-O)-methyltransferase RlmM [Marinomonas sp. M1K-6]|uniref:Ribosomal RNA large subunit methyltransferase M n=1 Tax=Marinomonas profundi TaxID=2726122 RepID=A0A847R3H4_9GAMM|nr:23S rRNA (cytidine(2498)-2'-O)-methyltransferase RlmM [Marinomonas profundi]NLQ16933.1 23S rRNA (cytidine(2498)-2'-O)-methyltransferase RlmM [Marinomonas profundi]UDV02662.1 23S rRNA (cytidine(2498)-2'-O)-methyltransferase RlmM [Marinomonas profundi]
MKNVLVYCRQGFEKDCAAELSEVAASKGFYGYAKVVSDAGYIVYNFDQADAGEALIQQLDFNRLIFARQIIAVNGVIELEQGGRVESLLEAARELPLAEEIWIETADTNEAKALSNLIKKLEKPLREGWKKSGVLRNKAVEVRHHVFMLDGESAYLGVSYASCRSDFPMGIRRLRFPAAGPSRSTLKLEEAFLQFVPERTREADLTEGMTAVDLGAAPGGWTYQFVKKGIHVIAIDNGPMQKELMSTGLVQHEKADGFKYEPPYTVDWLVCDMVERPIKVAELMAKWLASGWTRRAIFNLKLPMKKRYQEVTLCLQTIEALLKKSGVSYHYQVKHLYHDREEVTVCIMVR